MLSEHAQSPLPQEEKALEDKLKSLGAWFSIDPELDKPHPLLSYDSYAPARRSIHQIDSFLMSESLYDPSVKWGEDAEKIIQTLQIVYVILGLLLFGYLTIEKNQQENDRQPNEPVKTEAYWTAPEENVSLLDLESQLGESDAADTSR